jgi:hypothetical protein
VIWHVMIPGAVPHHPVRLRHHDDRDADLDVRSAVRR